MAPPDGTRRLIVNADDFGKSHSVNQAVLEAHHRGILTTASLMVNEPGFPEAVELARNNPRLGIGLHLTLSHGHSTLPAAQIPALVNSAGEFPESPAMTGLRYYFRRDLRESLAREIRAQFDKFYSTGLPLDHVNGHLHFHLHPTIFSILLEEHFRRPFKSMRFTREPFWLNARLAGGRWFYRSSHALIYRCLSSRARARLAARGIRHTQRVFGLLQNALVDESYILRLLPRLPTGDSELYSHPSLHEFKHEFEALISPRVLALVRELRIQLIRYQDL